MAGVIVPARAPLVAKQAFDLVDSDFLDRLQSRSRTACKTFDNNAQPLFHARCQQGGYNTTRSMTGMSRRHRIFVGFFLASLAVFFIGTLTVTMPLVVVGGAAILVLFIVWRGFLRGR